MSHLRLKTEYSVEGPYGSTEKRTLYAWLNNSCDVTSFYNERGEFLFATQEWDSGNDLLDAINRLAYPSERNGDLQKGVEHVKPDEWKKINQFNERDKPAKNQ